MARTGKGDRSKQPTTVYLDPEIHKGMEHFAHHDYSSESEWCRDAIAMVVRKRIADDEKGKEVKKQMALPLTTTKTARKKVKTAKKVRK